MSNNSNSYNGSLYFFIKSLIALSLIVFVLFKPVKGFLSQISEDKIELCSYDFDQDEEDPELEDHMDDDKIHEQTPVVLNCFTVLFDATKSGLRNHQHTSEYESGIVVPPPEFV